MKKNLFILAAALAVCYSCSNDETVEVNQGEAINFRPLVNNVTRAASVVDVTTANLTSFTVNAMKASTETSYFSNAVYTGTSGGTFTCATKYYWPSSDTEKLDFYAYAPANNSQVTYTNFKTFTVTPTAGTDPANQVDLVYAATKGKDKTTNGASGVTLNFRHTGAKIVCKVKNTSTTMKFGVEGWKVGYLYPNGTFVFADANTDGQNTGSGTTLSFSQWTPGGTKESSVEYASTFSKVDIAAGAEATPLDGEMILVPQTLTAATAYANSGSAAAGDKLNNTFIAVKLYALNNTTAGELIAGGGTTASPSTIWAIWPIGGYNWEPGKKYTYTVDLAGCGYFETNQDTDPDLDPILENAEIKFVSVTVDDWDEANYTVGNMVYAKGGSYTAGIVKEAGQYTITITGLTASESISSVSATGGTVNPTSGTASADGSFSFNLTVPENTTGSAATVTVTVTGATSGTTTITLTQAAS